MSETTTPEQRARRRANEFTGVMWHITTFVVINGFLWTIDIVTGEGLQWAYWTTIPWGIGLLFHIASYLIDRGGDRKYDKFLVEERQRSEP